MGAEHWEEIYRERPPDSVGWFEPDPVTSRTLVERAVREGARSVIDVGGGSSRLVDHLLDLGVEGLAVLDISSAGLDVSKRRLGKRADRVEWIVADVTRVADVGRFDVWHDRAVFHFLTDAEDRRRYVELAARTIRPGGIAIMATFAPEGPDRCSGLDVRRYDAAALAEECGPAFELLASEAHDHVTPRGVHQAFQYSTFRRLDPALVATS